MRISLDRYWIGVFAHQRFPWMRYAAFPGYTDSSNVSSFIRLGISMCLHFLACSCCFTPSLEASMDNVLGACMCFFEALMGCNVASFVDVGIVVTMRLVLHLRCAYGRGRVQNVVCNLADGVTPIWGPFLVLESVPNTLSPHSGGTNFWSWFWVRIPAPKQEPRIIPEIRFMSGCV